VLFAKSRPKSIIVICLRGPNPVCYLSSCTEFSFLLLRSRNRVLVKMSEKESSKDGFEKLVDGNYATWAIFMRAWLVRKGLWEVTDGTETKPLGSENSKAVKSWNRKNTEALAEITLHTDKSQLSHLRAETAAEVWKNLARIHRARGFSTRLALRRRFYSLRKRENQTMANWISTVRSLGFALEEIDVNVDDEDLILVLTMGLPSTYEGVINQLDSLDIDPDSEESTTGSVLTLNYVVTRLLNAESRINAAPHLNTESIAAAATMSSERPGTRKSHAGELNHLSRITCFGCGQKGHYFINCPAIPRQLPLAIDKATTTAPVANTAVTLPAYDFKDIDGAW
jgi:hypothetical protein